MKLIFNYSSQILQTLNEFHNNRVYFLNLHSGNVLLDNNNRVKLVDFEGFYFDFPIKNEQYYHYLINLYIEEYFHDKQNQMLNDIFTPKVNIFEIIDIVSFGRLLYEMHTGKELNAPYPDPIEYQDMNEDIEEILKLIFPFKMKMKKGEKIRYIGFPEVKISDVLNLKYFKSNLSNSFKVEKDGKKNNIIETERNKNADFSVYSDNFKLEFDTLSYIKEEIFNQYRFINGLMAKIKNYKN